MRITENWTDYRLIDCTDGEKLELWKDISLIRPDPQIIWKTEKSPLFGTLLTGIITVPKGAEDSGLSKRKFPKAGS